MHSLPGFRGQDAATMPNALLSRLRAGLRFLTARGAARLAGPLVRRTGPDPGTQADATFRTLLDIAGEGLCGLDREGRCTFINTAGAAQLGYAPEELLGRRFHPVHHHSRADGAPYPEEACPISQTLGSGRSCRVEDEVFWRRDGSCFPVAYAAHPILKGGTVVGAVVAYTDITARQWLETTLRESEARFKSAFDHAAVGMALIEPSGRLLRVNRAFGAMLGYAPQTLEGLTWQELTHPEDRDGNLREFHRLLAGEIPSLHLEKRYLHRDGRVVWGLVNASPVRDESGTPLYCVSHVLDLTDRKRALEALEESDRRFAAFMNNTTVVAWMKDVHFRYVYVSEPYERLIGIRREQIAGRTDLEVFPEETARQLRRNDAEVLRTGLPLETHETAPDREGRLRTWWVYKFPFRDAAGRVFVGGMAFDITERDRIERALRDREQELLRLLDEREQLIQDLHDGIIQEIYAIGLGLLETRRVLREDPAQGERRLDDAVADLNQVIRELRTHLDDQEAGTLTGAELPEALARWLRTLADIPAPAFTVNVDPAAAARLTPEQARQLFSIARELMSNSQRHARATAGQVSLCMEDDRLRLVVEDDGVGFDPQTPGRSGYGLRNLRARAGRLGATVAIQSRPGAGTRITLELPLRRPD